MVGIVLIYFLGKAFYDLAARHEKNKWGIAIAAVAIYYGITFLAGVVAALILIWQGNEDFNETLVGMIGIPFGLLACWVFYYYMKRRFEGRQPVKVDSLDAEFLKND